MNKIFSVLYVFGPDTPKRPTTISDSTIIIGIAVAVIIIIVVAVLIKLINKKKKQ